MLEKTSPTAYRIRCNMGAVGFFFYGENLPTETGHWIGDFYTDVNTNQVFISTYRLVHKSVIIFFKIDPILIPKRMDDTSSGAKVVAHYFGLLQSQVERVHE